MQALSHLPLRKAVQACASAVALKTSALSSTSLEMPYLCSQSNCKKVMDSEKFQAGWHDVIQVDETLIGKPFARWAIVVFIEAHGVLALPRTETHKWYTA